MNSNNNPENMEDFSEEIDMDDLATIDDFIKELEAREKDLHISSEMVIEIEDSDFGDSEFDEKAVEAFFLKEPVEPKIAAIEPIVASETVFNEVPFSEVAFSEDQISGFEKEIDSLKKKIEKMEAQRTELFELSRRRQTDFDNYRKRTERDRNETFNNHLSNLAMQILPVLDNLNRAMDSAAELPGEKTLDFQQFFDGIVLVNKQLKEVLSEMGVKPIESVGKPFDPHFHEAVATEVTEEVSSNTVIEELLRGYILGEKVIRPAMVKVSTSLTSNNGNSLAEML